MLTRIIKSIGYIIYFTAGAIGLVWGLKIIASMWGVFWAFICLLIFPFPIYVSPWIAAIRDGDWRLFIVVYGGTAILLIANLFDSD